MRSELPGVWMLLASRAVGAVLAWVAASSRATHCEETMPRLNQAEKPGVVPVPMLTWLLHGLGVPFRSWPAAPSIGTTWYCTFLPWGAL